MTTNPAGENMPWHSLGVEQAFRRCGSGADGLSAEEAARRQGRYGANELTAQAPVSAWSVLLAQFRNALILILLAAAALSAVLGHGVEAVAIAVIVTFSIVLGFVQEYRAERAIEALRRLAAPTATVLRAGEELELPARELVPGDVVLLYAGDKVPADVRLIEAVNLQLDEAALTGESQPVEKHCAPLTDGALALGDRRNLAFAGTAVSYGRGRGLVVATGMATEFGQIARMLESVEAGKTPLQQNLDRVGQLLARTGFVVVGLTVALGLARGQGFVDMLIFGIALAVAVVPEALPAVVTISLAIGVQRMVKRHALMRRLPAVETLGSTSVICSDKTGTLTKDEMTVQRLHVAGRTLSVTGAGYAPEGQYLDEAGPVPPFPALLRLLEAAVLASDAHLVCSEAEGRWQVKGDPTEGALVVAAAKAGIVKADLDAAFPRVGEIPFTAETKRMTTLHRGPDGSLACVKGAPEVVLAACATEAGADGGRALTPARREALLAVAQAYAGQALRVLAVAAKPAQGLEDAQHGLSFLGLVGLRDPLRPEAREAIAICEAAGIKAVMITGDHPLTAQAIARDLGLLREGRVLTGAELEAQSDAELEAEVERIEVYARVSPAHKLRVVSAWQRRGHIVAMTGDGVNDAPALKKADIGIAMGVTGTDVSREAAAMTLTDDNFASIVAAVEEGRLVFDNIKKYLMYLLSSNIGEMGLMLAAAVLGLPLPLSAVQILYVNLATDGLPALALALDPADPALMRRRPRDPRTGIFTRPVLSLMAVGGLWSTAVNLGLFLGCLNAGYSLARAMCLTFVSLVLIQFFKAYNFRSDRDSVLRQPFTNRWLNGAVLWELGLLALLLYAPPLQKVFGTYALGARDWLLVFVLAGSVVPVLELAKWWLRRRPA